MDYPATLQILEKHKEFLNKSLSHLMNPEFTRADIIWVVQTAREWFKALDPILDFYESDPRYEPDLAKLEFSLSSLLISIDSMLNMLDDSSRERQINPYWMS